MENDFESIQLALTKGQIQLLGSHVDPFRYVCVADAHNYAVLLNHNLVQRVTGILHPVSFSGNRAGTKNAARYNATERGRAWFEWYEKQPED